MNYWKVILSLLTRRVLASVDSLQNLEEKNFVTMYQFLINVTLTH